LRLPDLPEQKLEDAGKLLLRVTVGGLMLFHGVHKVLHGIDGIRTIMAKSGLPSFFAYGVYVGEVIAPILIIAGFWSRPAALVFAFNMLVAVATVHLADVTRLGRSGEWPIELHLLYMLGALVVALVGPGKWSLSAGKSRLG
jgi:putative oxidoreductase